tara:strand:+ start:170 stop:475 length:306 start_codon:yes stop_codon:yes gene_type:complete
MTIREFFELIWDVLTFPKYFFKAEFWQGILDLQVSALFSFIFLLLFIYSIFKALMEEDKNETEKEKLNWKFWEGSFWLFENQYPKPITFIITYIILSFINR